ncbi:MAG: hydroxymethylpyrimidine/phosphomethylpyrimidine kinase [Thioalkalivibrionaceae bacterium]
MVPEHHEKPDDIEITDARVATALSIAGSDPGGGAGAQADLATFLRLGVHGATAITAITVQDTQRVESFDLVRSETLARQIEITLEDCRVAAIKIGMLGSVDNVCRVAAILDNHRDIPVVLDPVMVAGGGGTLATQAVVDATRAELLPRASIITPNWAEALRLTAPRHDADLSHLATRLNTPRIGDGHSMQDQIAAEIAILADAVAETLNGFGCEAVLITGGDPPISAPPNDPPPAGNVYDSNDTNDTYDNPAPPVCNHWYRRGQPPQRFELPRHRGVFHGSGCTLAAAIAAHLALGHTQHQAVLGAQDFMIEAISRAYRSGHGQWIPERRHPVTRAIVPATTEPRRSDSNH